MIQILDNKTFRDGQIIFEQGSMEDSIYNIVSGSVELYKQTAGESILVEVFHPGDIFGETVFLAKSPNAFSAKSLGTTKVSVIDTHSLNQEYNHLSMNFKMILKSLNLRLEKAIEKKLVPKLRRDYPRVPISIALNFKSGSALVNAFSGDVSTTGLFIKTDEPLAVGQQFLLKLQLPDNLSPLTIGCKVVWNRAMTEDQVGRQLGMGVHFVDISSGDRQRLKEAIVKFETISD